MQKQQENTGIPLSLFYSYAEEDEVYRKELETHLAQLHRQGLISEWHDREILAGSEWGKEIDAHLQTASIILLLISPDFLASDYCYDIEMRQALERHKRGEAHVIPIILRPCDWKHPPIDALQALPTGNKPVILWDHRDEAWLDVEQGIRKVVVRTLPSQETPPSPPFSPASSFTGTPAQRVLPPGQTTQAQQALSREETAVQSMQHPASGGVLAAGSPVAEDEGERPHRSRKNLQRARPNDLSGTFRYMAFKYGGELEILRRIRQEDVPASWQVFRPAKNHSLWHSISYYFPSDEGQLWSGIILVSAILFAPILLGILAEVMSSWAPFLVGYGIILTTACVVIGIFSWRAATKSVLVVTPDRFLWGNWEKVHVEKAFRYRDYTSLNSVEGRLAAINEVWDEKLRRTREQEEYISFPALFGPPRDLARTIADAHKQFLRSNQAPKGRLHGPGS